MYLARHVNSFSSPTYLRSLTVPIRKHTHTHIHICTPKLISFFKPICYPFIWSWWDSVCHLGIKYVTFEFALTITKNKKTKRKKNVSKRNIAEIRKYARFKLEELRYVLVAQSSFSHLCLIRLLLLLLISRSLSFSCHL